MKRQQGRGDFTVRTVMVYMKVLYFTHLGGSVNQWSLHKDANHTSLSETFELFKSIYFTLKSMLVLNIKLA